MVYPNIGTAKVRLFSVMAKFFRANSARRGYDKTENGAERIGRGWLTVGARVRLFNLNLDLKNG